MHTHTLSLTTTPFEAIADGKKTVESRLWDEKRQRIALGDTLIFTHRDIPENTITARVIGLLRYSSFEELFTHNDPAKFDGSSPQALLDQIHTFYTVDQEQAHGVIGIEFQVEL